MFTRNKQSAFGSLTNRHLGTRRLDNYELPHAQQKILQHCVIKHGILSRPRGHELLQVVRHCCLLTLRSLLLTLRSGKYLVFVREEKTHLLSFGLGSFISSSKRTSSWARYFLMMWNSDTSSVCVIKPVVYLI